MKNKIHILPIIFFAICSLVGCNSKELSNLDQRINDLESQINELEQEINSFKSDLIDLETEMNESIKNTKSEFNTKISEAEKNLLELNANLENLKNEHDEDIEALENEYNAQIVSLKEEEENKRELIKEDYDKKISDLEEEYNQKIKEIESSISATNKDIETLNASFNERIQNIQNEYNSYINDITARIAALESVEYHIVTFDSNGGNDILPLNVIHGEVVSKPADPVRPGYTFDGWYYMGNPWFFKVYTVSEDIVLTAKWVQDNYTVLFTNYDGTILESHYGVHYGESVQYEGLLPEKPNSPHYIYTFAGWDAPLTNIKNNTTFVAQYNDIYVQYEAWNQSALDNALAEIDLEGVEIPKMDYVSNFNISNLNVEEKTFEVDISFATELSYITSKNEFNKNIKHKYDSIEDDKVLLFRSKTNELEIEVVYQDQQNTMRLLVRKFLLDNDFMVKTVEYREVEGTPTIIIKGVTSYARKSDYKFNLQINGGSWNVYELPWDMSFENGSFVVTCDISSLPNGTFFPHFGLSTSQGAGEGNTSCDIHVTTPDSPAFTSGGKLYTPTTNADTFDMPGVVISN